MTEMQVTDLPPEIADRVAKVAPDTDVPRAVDYFALDTREWVTLPDGVQRVCVKVLSSGERTRYLQKTNREVTMNSRTKDLRMITAAGEDEAELLRMAVVDWEVQTAGAPLRFDISNLNSALMNWPVEPWQVVLAKVRDMNPWLKGTEDDLPAMREEYAELGKRIADLEARGAKSG